MSYEQERDSWNNSWVFEMWESKSEEVQFDQGPDKPPPSQGSQSWLGIHMITQKKQSPKASRREGKASLFPR
ncbi:hypothetical protein I79_012129 [Cricetulus griseus]|uniref:Uncharacterized protein n=1 Tax=Cricetulus griseus TaxID=10029 RepID=G3HMZ9_CRIGR|nr:hypothetical protein I79_012129 [Cricetulus griseus]